MPFPLIPLLVMAATGIGQAIANRRNQKKAAQENLDANMELAKYQNQINVEQWERQNKYNTPQSQMDRWRAAGLNPNLIYGQGNAGNAGSIPSFEKPTYHREIPSMQFPDMIATFQNFNAMQAKTNNMKASTDLLSQKARTEAVNRMNSLLKGERGRFDFELAKELRKYNVNIRQSESTSANLKARTIAQELGLLEQFGSRERQSRLKSQALSQARQMVDTKSAEERLALLKQFGWTTGYQQSALQESKILSAQQQATFDKLKTQLFRQHEMTPNDNFFLRMLVHWMSDNDVLLEDLQGVK